MKYLFIFIHVHVYFEWVKILVWFLCRKIESSLPFLNRIIPTTNLLHFMTSVFDHIFMHVLYILCVQKICKKCWRHENMEMTKVSTKMRTKNYSRSLFKHVLLQAIATATNKCITYQQWQMLFCQPCLFLVSKIQTCR